MPFVASAGVRTYYEAEGSGPPLVLHIGFLGSLNDWRREDAPYAQALRDEYTLILVDPRGQGRSDTPHDPAQYTLEARAGDIVAVLDALGIDRAHFWGYSMGGGVGFMLAARHQHRLRSLVVGGASPWVEPTAPEANDWYHWMADGMDAFVAGWERTLGPIPTGARERWLAEDAEALRASMRAPDQRGELRDALPSMTLPALLYVGTDDIPEPVERAARMMPNATFVPLAGLNHPQAFRRTDLVLPHALAFLARVDAPTG